MGKSLQKKRNLRDLSYLARKDGKRLKEGIFFRSASIRKMNRKHQRDFLSLGVKEIIDLRTPAEIERKPDLSFEGISYHPIPIISEEALGVTHEKSLIAYKTPPNMVELYARMVSDPKSIDALKKVFSHIFDPEFEGGILWHCTEGKDRCGIVSALFLLALGFEEEDVFRDYCLNHPVSEKKGRVYRFLVRYVIFRGKALSDAVYRTMLAVPEYLSSAMDRIKADYGTVLSFFDKALGIDDKAIEAFKARYLIG